jgi:hypothetical protein
MNRGQVNSACESERIFARYFDKTGIAAECATTDIGMAIKTGMVIRPKNNRTALASLSTFGVQDDMFGNEKLVGRRKAVAALIFTADFYGSAICATGCRDVRTVTDVDRVTECVSSTPLASMVPVLKTMPSARGICRSS